MTYFMYNDGSTLIVSSDKGPSSIMIKYLSISACTYAPGISKHDTSISSYDYMSAVRNNDYAETIGEVLSSLLMYVR